MCLTPCQVLNSPRGSAHKKLTFRSWYPSATCWFAEVSCEDKWHTRRFPIEHYQMLRECCVRFRLAANARMKIIHRFSLSLLQQHIGPPVLLATSDFTIFSVASITLYCVIYLFIMAVAYCSALRVCAPGVRNLCVCLSLWTSRVPRHPVNTCHRAHGCAMSDCMAG